MGGNISRGRYDFDDLTGLSEQINPLLGHGLLTGLTDDDHAQYLPLSGIRAMTGTLDMSDNNITNVDTISGTGVGNLALSTGGGLFIECQRRIQIPDGSEAAPGLRFASSNADGLYYANVSSHPFTATGVGIADDLIIEGTNTAIRLIQNSGRAFFYRASNSGHPNNALLRALGTFASPLAVTDDTILGTYAFNGYDGSIYTNAGGFQMAADQTWVAAPSVAHGSRCEFRTVVNGETSAAVRMTLDNTGTLNLLDGNFVIPDGGTIGSASDADSITIDNVGKVTLTQDLTVNEDIIIGNAKFIGPVGDPDAMQFGASGKIILSQGLRVAGLIEANGGVTLGAGDDLIGSSTSDIAIGGSGTEKFTVAGATGNTVIVGTLGVTGVATLGDSSQMATSAAPTADADIANKKYVDDNAGGFGADVTKSVFIPAQSLNDATVVGAWVGGACGGKVGTWSFQAGQTHSAGFSFVIPEDFDSAHNPTLEVLYSTSTNVSGQDVDFTLDYAWRAVDQDMPAGGFESQQVTDGESSGSNDGLTIHSFTLINVAASDQLLLARVIRPGSTDGYGSSVYIWGFRFKYTANKHGS